MKKEHNKLVRDKIPEIIAANGEKSKIRILGEDEFKEELLKKIVEEAKEVFETKGDREELKKEIGDVFEVIEYLIKIFDLDRGEIEAIKQKRKEKRGGFDKGLFLEYTE